MALKEIIILDFHDLDCLGLLNIFQLFDIMMILDLAQPYYFVIMKTNWSEYVQLVASSPAILHHLNKVILFDSATFEYGKQNLCLRLCKDTLSHQLILMVTFKASHRNCSVLALAAVAQRQFPKFAIFD
ncbi:MAG: hypothetical protein ACI9DJ_003456 [Algoriphagus sp.]|jgi:hypothetical protein